MITLKCGEHTLELCYIKGLTLEENMMNYYGWLLRPIMEIEGSLENTLQKLNWNITYDKTNKSDS